MQQGTFIAGAAYFKDMHICSLQSRQTHHTTPPPTTPGSSTSPKKLVLVVAVALLDDQQRVLLAQRPPGRQMSGLWEFPGGKVSTAACSCCCQPSEHPHQLRMRSCSIMV